MPIGSILAAIADGLAHSAIPQEESHHLWVTMHHGHLQGQHKCKGQGDKALCARCLQLDPPQRHEESVLHEYHECPKVRKGVWEPLAVLRRSTDGWNGHDASFSTLDVQLQTALQVRSDTPRARPT